MSPPLLAAQTVSNRFVAFQAAAERAALDPKLSGFGASGAPHRPNERVAIRDLVDCTTAIALTIDSWRRKSDPARSHVLVRTLGGWSDLRRALAFCVRNRASVLGG
jgi:hypothetical protein